MFHVCRLAFISENTAGDLWVINGRNLREGIVIGPYLEWGSVDAGREVQDSPYHCVTFLVRCGLAPHPSCSAPWTSTLMWPPALRSTHRRQVVVIMFLEELGPNGVVASVRFDQDGWFVVSSTSMGGDSHLVLHGSNTIMSSSDGVS